MYNKPSQRAFQSLVTPASLPQKPLQIRSPENSQNNSRRPSHLNSSPSKDPENALNFYLSLPKKAGSVSVSKTARNNVAAQENIVYENENFTTEPVQYTQAETYSPPKGSKSANRFIGHGSILFQNSKNRDQKGKSRGIDSVNQQMNKESAYSTAVISSPKISAYHSVNTAQTHLIVRTPNVNRNLENQINQTVGSYLDNQNHQDEENYWEILEKKCISPMQQSVITNKHYQSEVFPWDQENSKTSQRTAQESNELFSSPRSAATGYEIGSPQASYPSSRRTSKPESYQQEIIQQSVRSNMESRRSDKPYTFEGEPKEQVRSPGQVRKTKKHSEQRGNSGTWKDIGEDLGISKRSNYSDKEKARLMEELMNLQRELEEKNMEAQELQEEERRQDRENQRMMEEINEIEKARKENEEVIRQLKERSKVQVKDISRLKKCKEELERNLKEFGGKAKEFKECSNRVKKCREEVDKTNKQILQLNKRLERISQEESEAIEEERMRTEQELRRLEAEVASRDEEIRELEKELIDVNEKKEEYKLVAEKITELEELQRELMEENDNLRDRLESFFKDQTNSYKQAQDSELNARSLQEKEHKDMEEVSVNLLKVRRRLEEIETYSKKIMKILEFSKQGKEIPIELILPHNRSSRPERKNSKIEDDVLFFKKLNKTELKNAVIENIRLADDTRRRLEQNVANMLEGYLKKNRENEYY